MAKSATLTEAASATAANTESARPIESPRCTYNGAREPLATYAVGDQQLSPSDLLNLISGPACNASCEAPASLDPDVVVVVTNQLRQKCEISVGLAHNLEAYVMSTGNESVPANQQECQESIGNMIDAINNQPQNCVWNGTQDDEMDFKYRAGFRQINVAWSLHGKAAVNITSTLAAVSATATSSTPAPSSSAQNSGSEVNVGAIAGGVVGGVAVILAFVAFVLWRRTQRRKIATAADASDIRTSDSGPPGDMKTYPPVYQPAELDPRTADVSNGKSNPLYEMDTEPPLHELDAPEGVHRP